MILGERTARGRKKRIRLVSVIIPTFNEAGNLRRVLSGVRDVLDGVYDYEIIVVDKHSADGTAGIARSMGATVIYDDIGKGSAPRRL